MCVCVGFGGHQRPALNTHFIQQQLGVLLVLPGEADAHLVEGGERVPRQLGLLLLRLQVQQGLALQHNANTE